jgi:C4-type Zn-finger protein
MKTKKKSEKYVRVCPICKSVKLSINNSNPFFVSANIWEYKCRNCGYKNVQSLFPEMKISEKTAKRKKHN